MGIWSISLSYLFSYQITHYAEIPICPLHGISLTIPKNSSIPYFKNQHESTIISCSSHPSNSNTKHHIPSYNTFEQHKTSHNAYLRSWCTSSSLDSSQRSRTPAITIAMALAVPYSGLPRPAALAGRPWPHPCALRGKPRPSPAALAGWPRPTVAALVGMCDIQVLGL
jgi:hypothetical protein